MLRPPNLALISSCRMFFQEVLRASKRRRPSSDSGGGSPKAATSLLDSHVGSVHFVIVNELRVTSLILCRHGDLERPFTRQTWLRPARNFAKPRFKQFRTFDFSTPKNFFGENFRRIFLFFASLVWILTSYGETDVKISFRVKFCSR